MTGHEDSDADNLVGSVGVELVAGNPVKKKRKMEDSVNNCAEVTGNGNESELCEMNSDSISTNSGVESFQAKENRYLERKCYYLQKMLDMEKDFRLETMKSRLSCGTSTDSLGQSNILVVLPEVVLKEILKGISNQRTLMNCRLVSAYWNSIIEDTAELMKTIIFPVSHPKTFLDLAIVKKGKVKAIKFLHPFQLKSKYTKEFIRLISKVKPVEKVEFQFEDPDFASAEQNELFKLILKKCSNLQELIVSTTLSLSCLDKSQKVFRGITTSTNVATVGISYLCVNVAGFTEEDGNGLVELLLKLPKLKEIELVSYCESYFIIITGICEYMKNYDSVVLLKKLTLSVNHDFKREDLSNLSPHLEIFTLLLILCEKHSVVLRLKDKQVDFNSFLELTETPNLPLLKRRPLFSAKVSGELTFRGQKLNNLDRFDSLNIHDLRLYFRRDLIEGELSWLKKINSLECLIFETTKNNLKLGSPTIQEFEETFSAGLPSLNILCVFFDVFDSIRVFRWSQYFPNVTEVHFIDCKLTPDYLISELSVLESLSRLTFDDSPNLKDLAFTIDCVNKFGLFGLSQSLDNVSIMAPAICCFKTLKYLHIVGCPLLTNECVINNFGGSTNSKL